MIPAADALSDAEGVFYCFASIADLMGKAILSQHERVRCEGFTRTQRKQAFTAGRTLLRRLVGAVRNIDTHKIELFATGHGQLQVVNCAGSVNLSHSGQLVAAAYAQQGMVGIDLQERKPVDRWRDLAQRLFLRTVSAWIARQPEPELAFLDVFSAAESVGKALGTGWAGGAGRQLAIDRGNCLKVKTSSRHALQISRLPTAKGFVAWVCHGPGLPLRRISV